MPGPLSNYRNDRTDSRIGQRVELPAFSDQWMRGARFGTVRQVLKALDADDVLAVRCDNPRIRRLYRHFAQHFTARG